MAFPLHGEKNEAVLSLLQDELLTDSVRDPAGNGVLIRWGRNPSQGKLTVYMGVDLGRVN